MAGYRLDGVDHLFVGNLFACAEEAGVAAIHEDSAIAFRVATQGVDELPTFALRLRESLQRPYRSQGWSADPTSIG